MITINVGCIKEISCNPDPIGSIAFYDGGFAMITKRRCGITKLNKDFCCVEKVRTERRYKYICFDKEENCFWACEDETPCIIYKLDMCFCEIGMVKLHGSQGRHLRGISCDPCCDTLLLCFFNAIERVNKQSGKCEPVCCIKENQLNFLLQALCDGYMVAYLRDGTQHIAVKCHGCDKQAELSVPRGYSLEGIFLYGLCPDEAEDCISYEIGLLLSKKCEDSLAVLDIVVTCCKRVVPPCPPPYPPCPPPYPPCPPHPPYPPFPPIPCLSCCCGKYEIMHSVALEEAGIAHILNAEGEKIQRAVAECSSIEELLAVNESVRRTITQVSILEGQLYSKLDALSGICDGEDPCSNMPCPCCDDSDQEQ